VQRGGFVDRVIGVLSVAVIAVPSFVIAIYALLVFAVALQWLPAIGAGDPAISSASLTHLILPSLAVGLGWVGYIARMVRASMLETLEAGHIRTARAFGLTERRIVYSYALRIAILPTDHPARCGHRAHAVVFGLRRDRLCPPRHRQARLRGDFGAQLSDRSPARCW
jgi:peptide/nickel transport system permease protein